MFVGVVESIVDLQRLRGLLPATDDILELSTPRHTRSLVEAVVSGTSPLVGQSIRDARFRTRYGAVVIAVHRAGERIEGKIGDIVLRAGDMLLLEAPPSFAETYRNSWDFFLVSPVANSQPRNHDKAWIALAILGGFIALAAFDVMSEFNAALLAGGRDGPHRLSHRRAMRNAASTGRRSSPSPPRSASAARSNRQGSRAASRAR